MPPSALAPNPEVEFAPLRYRVHAFRQLVSPDTDRAAHPGRLEQERGGRMTFRNRGPRLRDFSFQAAAVNWRFGANSRVSSQESKFIT